MDNVATVKEFSPGVILIFSGKRKCGKDYVTEALQNRLGSDTCSILRLSGPLKSQYAQEHDLDATRLLDATEYKETYRADMIAWGERRRVADPGYFCRAITEGPGADRPVWLISDARRLTDVEFFQSHYAGRVVTVRVVADDSVREARGWRFTADVDDAESECGLDDGVTFDYVVSNNGDTGLLIRDLYELAAIVNSRLDVV